MATAGKNLSEFDRDAVPSAAPYTFALVVSEWNREITDKLAQGALDTLISLGAAPERIDLQFVPGSFELPSGAKLMLERNHYDAAIAIGSVIQGETRHFDF